MPLPLNYGNDPNTTTICKVNKYTRYHFDFLAMPISVTLSWNSNYIRIEVLHIDVLDLL